MIRENDILFVAHKAGIKAYEVTATQLGTKDLKELININYIDSQEKLGDRVSDKAGSLGHHNGENHNMQRETQRKSLGMMVQDIKNVLSNNMSKHWHMSASKGIMNDILKNINKDLQKNLQVLIMKDLVKTNKVELLRHFR